MLILSNFLTNGAGTALYLMGFALAPLLIFAWLVHVFEQLISRRLSSRFGWNSVMWTAWLGTPIHELSHALMCLVFQHRVVEIELFKPDRQSGRLGYVHHSYQRGNLYQEIGNVFIGLAPLAGGTMAIIALLMLFYPDIGRATLQASTAEGNWWSCVVGALSTLFGGVLSTENLLTLRLWVFLYLVLCVGGHMAPSGSDYVGGIKGGVFVVALLCVASLIIALVWPDTGSLLDWLKPVFVPATSVLVAVLALCGIATAVVFVLTEIVDRVRGR